MIPLQFIVHTNTSTDCQEATTLALEAGCRWIRLHFDDDFSGSKETLAKEMLKACRKHQATFVIDSCADLCKSIEADGVHLSDTDMAATQARELLGHGYIIGGTAHSFADVKRLKGESADYVCCGPYAGTSNLQSPQKTLEIEDYKQIANEMKAEELRIPICAMGNIKQDDVWPLLYVGVQGVAISSEEMKADEVKNTILEILNADE